MIAYASCSAIYDINQEVAGGLTGSGALGAGAALALPPKILYITVPQVGHFPLIALRPFFVVTSIASVISFFALHLTQYPSDIEKFAGQRFMRQQSVANTLEGGSEKRQQGKEVPTSTAAK